MRLDIVFATAEADNVLQVFNSTAEKEGRDLN
jgi:hypothetical protein